MERKLVVMIAAGSGLISLAAFPDAGAAQSGWTAPPGEQGPAATPPARPKAGQPAQPPEQKNAQPRQQSAIIDADRDGGLNRNELLRAREQAFVKMDANNDGKLVRAEVEGVRDRLNQAWAARRPELAATQPPPPLDVDHFFTVNDRNRDAGITKAEFMLAVEERFQLLDLNKDGRITKEEVQATSKRK